MAIDRDCPWCGVRVRDRTGDWCLACCPSCGKRLSKAPDRHRWGLNLWVTDAEEAKLRVYFASSERTESLAESARRLLLAEAQEGDMSKPVGRGLIEDLGDHRQVKNLLNGDACRIGEDTPIAKRLLAFLQEPGVSEAWQRFNQGRSRL